MKFISMFTAAVLLGTATPAIAGHHSQSNLVETAVASPQHATLVAAVKAAELAETLSSGGPFTLFAPTDRAFARLPDGTVATLLKPENKAKLQAILTYHVVAGRVTAADLVSLIEKNNGSAMLTTVEGGMLTAMVKDGSVLITDENGGTATVVAADVKASNGVIHVTDAVLLPN